MLDSVEGKGQDDGDGGAHDGPEEQPAGGVGLHFVKLRPEPVTGENMRSLVQVKLNKRHSERSPQSFCLSRTLVETIQTARHGLPKKLFFSALDPK